MKDQPPHVEMVDSPLECTWGKCSFENISSRCFCSSTCNFLIMMGNRFFSNSKSVVWRKCFLASRLWINQIVPSPPRQKMLSMIPRVTPQHFHIAGTISESQFALCPVCKDNAYEEVSSWGCLYLQLLWSRASSNSSLLVLIWGQH